jgi:hypothetical protein
MNTKSDPIVRAINQAIAMVEDDGLWQYKDNYNDIKDATLLALKIALELRYSHIDWGDVSCVSIHPKSYIMEKLTHLAALFRWRVVFL